MKLNLQYFAEESEEETVVAEQEETEDDTAEQEEMVPKSAMKDRLDRKEKQHQKEMAGLKESMALLQAELEELKTNNMPEEERKSYKQRKAEKEEHDKVRALEKRERALILKENSISAREELSSKNINQNYVDFLVDNGKFETLEDKLDAFIGMITNDLNEGITTGVKQALSGTPPKASATTTGGSKNPFSKEHFNLTEQGRLLKEDPELFKQLKAQAK